MIYRLQARTPSHRPVIPPETIFPFSECNQVIYIQYHFLSEIVKVYVWF